MAAKPLVLSIALDFGASIERMHGALIRHLREKANFEQPEEVDEIISALRQNPAPSAVLIMDQSVANDFPEVWDAVLAYVRAGGTAIAMGMFSSFIVPANIKPFFAKAGLSWEGGAYLRTDMKLRPEVAGAAAEKLPMRFSMKGLLLKGVKADAIMYSPDDGSQTQSAVFPSKKVEDTTQAAVAFAQVGAGKIGYVGDVNAETELNDVILSMCGLLV
ncbi:triacylglycerol lipase-like protein [Colletotrichum sojae]|uniref:Triacylglycerol lipase-like protein n=1 Tax=Colletotrichum sojae TaxID=2175907 RepID=A0A8H6MQU8_9PEZI|nr:triacylglycerol lipase-like protein [Colletotrichum sojae]